MIGNLGRVAYSSISLNDENNGNGGNIPSEPALILKWQKASPFPWHEVEPRTVGTHAKTSTPVHVVPECMDVIGNNSGNKNTIEKQPVIKSVPVVSDVPTENLEVSDKSFSLQPVPKGRGIWKLVDFCTDTDSMRTERNTCYCCRGTDYWLGGTEQYSSWVCRKCHPPAPGAERQTINQPVTSAK